MISSDNMAFIELGWTYKASGLVRGALLSTYFLVKMLIQFLILLRMSVSLRLIKISGEL